jgi:hypothetical protein
LEIRVRRRRALAAALAVLLLPIVAGSVAAGPSKPTVTVTNTVTGTSVALAIAVNRGVDQIASCTYVVDTATAASCGTKTSQGKKAASYAVALTNQSPGDHTVTVTVALTDGGSGAGSTTFTIAAPPVRVFAIAFTNVDGVVGYQAGGTDVLIAKLVDTSGDDAIGAGDTVITDQFPKDFDFATAGFASFGDTSHAVLWSATAAGFVMAQTVDGSFGWFVDGTHESYQENSPGPISSFLADSFDGACDAIVISSLSPSEPPLPELSLQRCASTTNDPFMDVINDVPA